MPMPRTTPLAPIVEYPTSDGRPMAETDLHRDLMFALIAMLSLYYHSRRRVYVSGNLLLYYVRGNRRKHVSPDVFVVRGIAKRRREQYLLWEEGKGPEVVIEITSRSTRREDQGSKKRLYQNVLGVAEYFQFDPRGEYLEPSLQGFRLQRGVYVPIPAVDGRLRSRVLGLCLEADGQWLRLYNPRTGTYLQTPEEYEHEARTQAEHRAQAAEAEVERLRRELQHRDRPAGTV